jgi:hypothetical protein
MAASSRVVHQRYAGCHQEIRIDTNIAGHLPRRTLSIAAGSTGGLPDQSPATPWAAQALDASPEVRGGVDR